MKRKRGHKKGKKPKAPSASSPTEEPSVAASGNTEANSGNDEYESGMEVDTTSSPGPDPRLNADPDGSGDKAAGKPVGRVKVKLKTSKALESDAPSHSDTDRSSQQVDCERRMVSEKMEDSGNSSVEVKAETSPGVSKKAGSIIIKSSRTLSGSSMDMGGGSTLAQGQTSKRKELKTPLQYSRFNKKELESSLTVIKKVMKMEAAAPFNEPVNPEALGIPDYFDIIDTPMDFGTICTNLEKGDKYKNSKDVYKDVQFIWDNCSKYNNKGDAILDLMRRVKKNFMKYWTAACLYTGQSKAAGSNEADDSAVSSQGKTQMKGSQSKMKKGKHGRRHKSDCLCAICVLKRRKREREAIERLAKGQIGGQDQKQEELSPVDSPFGEDSSQNMDEMVDLDAEAEVEETRMNAKPEITDHQGVMDRNDREDEYQEESEEENKVKSVAKVDGETRAIDKESLIGDRSMEEPNRESQTPLEIVKSSVQVLQRQTAPTPAEQAEECERAEKQRRKEIEERKQKALMLGRYNFENPTLLSLCETLFPEDPKSVWCGPRSLLRKKSASSRTSSIHGAIKALME